MCTIVGTQLGFLLRGILRRGPKIWGYCGEAIFGARYYLAYFSGKEVLTFGNRITATKRRGNQRSTRFGRGFRSKPPMPQISMELPGWSDDAMEELRESVACVPHWEVDASWPGTILVAGCRFALDKVAGKQPGGISVASAQAMVARFRDHVRVRSRIVSLWACCCCQRLLARVLCVIGIHMQKRDEWISCCKEWVAALLLL